jgi:PilZ domain-containing protein
VRARRPVRSRKVSQQQERSSQRYPLKLDVEVEIGGDKKHGQSRNISLGGMYIESSERLAMGARLKVRFQVPTQREAVDVGAIVRWTDGTGFGVQFDGLRARDVWALGKYFEQQSH